MDPIRQADFAHDDAVDLLFELKMNDPDNPQARRAFLDQLHSQLKQRFLLLVKQATKVRVTGIRGRYPADPGRLDISASVTESGPGVYVLALEDEAHPDFWLHVTVAVGS